MEFTKRVFRDPFYEPPLQKGYYHPSQKKKLSKKERRICLSPEKQPSVGLKKDSKSLKPADEEFLKGTNVYTDKAPPTGDTPSPTTSASSKFNESWPESERASMIGLVPAFNLSPIQDSDRRLHSTKLDEMGPTTSDSDAPKRGMKGQTTSSAGRKEKNGDSTLQRYINRFRYGQPMSRQERESKTQQSSRDFWWLKSPSPSTPGRSSTPKGDDTPSPGKTKKRSPQSSLSPYSPMKPGRSSSSSSSGSRYRPHVTPIDEMTQKLQERADQLLEQSESSLSTEPIVSTLGLGSEPSIESSRSRGGASLVEERPYRPGFIRYMQEKENILHREDTRQPRQGPSLGAPPDDILSQWRLRRKMELAQTKGHYGIRLLDAARGPASPKKTVPDPEIESKLTDFRNRLSQAASGKYASPLKPSTKIHFTPSPPRQETKLPTSPERDIPERDVPLRPVIASPTLKRKPGSQEQVEPHLHLMCDILPCPHQSEHEKWVKYSERTEGGQGLEESRSGMQESLVEGDLKDRTCERVQQQARWVEREQPAENVQKSRPEKQKAKRDIPVCDEASKKREKDEKGRQMDGGRVLHESKEHWKSFDGSVSFEDDVPVRDLGPGGGRKDDEGVTGGMARVPHKKDSEKEEESQKMKQARRVPRPKRVWGSPKKTGGPLDNVVGEVVTERMFASPTSSIESFVSEKNKASETDQDTFTSDSEEFADDELLSQLRKQREKFESKLKLIDHLLEQAKAPK